MLPSPGRAIWLRHDPHNGVLLNESLQRGKRKLRRSHKDNPWFHCHDFNTTPPRIKCESSLGGASVLRPRADEPSPKATAQLSARPSGFT